MLLRMEDIDAYDYPFVPLGIIRDPIWKNPEASARIAVSFDEFQRAIINQIADNLGLSKNALVFSTWRTPRQRLLVNQMKAKLRGKNWRNVR